jgi:hypothetical protein
MFKRMSICLMIVAGSIYIPATVTAQEFPIAVGSDTTFGGDAAFDGTNYLIAIGGDASSKTSITAQFVSSSGSLVGARISLGKTGGTPKVAFDGTNYLLMWNAGYSNPFTSSDIYVTGPVYGQFINTSGNLVGTAFTIATGVNLKVGGAIAFNDTAYLVTYAKGGYHVDYLYGQRISRSGTLIGSPIQISSNYAREASLAYDGTNYLVAWCERYVPTTMNINLDRNIYGQFISKSGVLVGSNFLIDDGPNPSDNPVSVTFGGSGYVVCFHDQAADTMHRWNLIARLVSTSGSVATNRVTICDSTQNPFFPSAAFDGTNYLLTWITMSPSAQVKGRFYNTSGVPVDTAFVIFDTLGGKFPFGGVALFADNQFLAGAIRLDSNFTNGDIYGIFLKPSTTGVEKRDLNQISRQLSLSQNFLNPFDHSSADISFTLASNSCVSLKVFDLAGREMAALVNNEMMPAGTYTKRWNTGATSSGMYLYRLRAGSSTITTKALR